MSAEIDTGDTGDDGRERIARDAPTVSAITMISAPVEKVWRVVVAFDQYAQWHPVLSLDAMPEQVVVGAEVPARISGVDSADRLVTMTIVDVDAPRRLVWEGGSLDAILGRHSFVLTPEPDGTTKFTESEEFLGSGAAEVVPTLGKLSKEYARYGAALRARVDGSSD